MATDLVMPTLSSHQHHQQHQNPYQSPQFLESDSLGRPERPHHMRSHSYQLPRGPQISPTSTPDQRIAQQQNASTPSSPRSSYNARHVRPLYMPAVLRPNEFPARGGISTPKVRTPDNGAGTPDSASDSNYTLRRSSTSLIGINGLGALGQRLSRRLTAENDKMLNGEWNLDLYPPVIALPTRDHWKPDSESSICDDPTCKRNFNYFTRRHHCRKCGNIFCDLHSSYVIPLDQDANFNPRAAPSRACSHCFEMIRSWHSTENSQGSSSTSSAVSQTAPSSPVAARATLGVAAASSPDAAASVPRDWNWSTF